MSETEHIADEEVQSLIREIRADESSIISMCVHRLNTNDPQFCIDHDLTNNDGTLTLYERLAIAAKHGLRNKVIYLHRLQETICQRLEELGIEISQN